MTPLRWVTLVLCLAAGYVAWPLWPPILLAAWTAALVRPMLLRFERGLKGRRRAAAVLTLLLFVVLALPLALFGVGVIAGAQELLSTVRTSPTAASALAKLTSEPDTPMKLPSNVGDLLALLQRSGTQGLSLLSELAGAAATGLIGVLLYFAGAHTFLVDSATVWVWIKRHLPLGDEAWERFGRAFHETGRGLLFGVGLTTVAQGATATLVYFALGVPRAWVLGPLTGLASIIPVVGTALVWAPIAVGLFLTDRPTRAIVLVLVGVGVISVIDNLLRPFFARMGALEMPLLLLFVSVFGGLAVFGTWGALLGPLAVRLAMEALALSREAAERSRGAARPP